MPQQEPLAKSRPKTKDISVDETYFDLMASAINVLSRRTKRFETLSTVVVDALTSNQPVPTDILDKLPESNAWLGNIKVHFRVYDHMRPPIARMKDQLERAGRGECSLRDIIIVCCLLTIRREP
jgi:hypothetical protein